MSVDEAHPVEILVSCTSAESSPKGGSQIGHISTIAELYPLTVTRAEQFGSVLFCGYITNQIGVSC